MVLDEDKVFKDGYFSMQKGLPTKSKQIYKGFLLSAGFLFSTREFVDAVPYDPHLYFEGEETSLALDYLLEVLISFIFQKFHYSIAM